MERNVNRFVKVYPWYFGTIGDLLFYIAIDTLFLTVVKHLSSAEIVSILSFSQLACIVLQIPILFIMRKIGNTASLRVGAAMILLASIFITFGRSYYTVLIGKIFHDTSTIFRNAMVVALENNLDLVDRRKDFIRIRTTANATYSVITMLIALVVSYMFNFNNYLPMFCSIGTCTIGFVLSLFMKDYSPYDRVSFGKSKTGERVKIRYDGFLITAILTNALFYLVVANGQGEGKLFIQEHLLLDFDVEKTAVILGIVIFFSRVFRVISNLITRRVYARYRKYFGIALAAMICCAIGCMLFGSFIPLPILKIAVMSLGYMLILFIRDPFKLYMEDVVFENTPKEQHQTLVNIKEFGIKLACAGVGLIYSAMLLKLPMIAVIAVVFVLSTIEVLLSLFLYRAVMKGKRNLREHNEA